MKFGWILKVRSLPLRVRLQADLKINNNGKSFYFWESHSGLFCLVVFSLPGVLMQFAMVVSDLSCMVY